MQQLSRILQGMVRLKERQSHCTDVERQPDFYFGLPAYICTPERKGTGNLALRSGVKEQSVCKQCKPKTENVPTAHGCGKEHQQMFTQLPNNRKFSEELGA
ncbi:hypothetical protein STEG23_008707, partial [Scotinomys teguina]